MDFMVKLLPLKELMMNAVFDLVIIAVDRLIKDIIFILFKEAVIADKLIHIFL